MDAALSASSSASSLAIIKCPSMSFLPTQRREPEDNQINDCCFDIRGCSLSIAKWVIRSGGKTWLRTRFDKLSSARAVKFCSRTKTTRNSIDSIEEIELS